MIGILTFYWADDYGAMLQSYALKTCLNQYEKTVLIPYYPRALRSRYRALCDDKSKSFPRRLRRIARQLVSRSFYSRLRTRRDMRRFREKYLVGKRRSLATPGDICRFGKEIDTYVAGSDQIWNPEITEGFQEGYFCAFPKKGKTEIRCVAYAASIGSERLDEKYEKAFSRLLSNFDAVSLREPCSAAFVGRLYGKEIQTVLDPVFLLEREEWEAFLKNLPGEKRGDRKRKYIALYYTEYNQSMAGYLERLEERTGLGTLILKPQRQMHVWSRGAEYAVCHDPLEFLHGLFHAEYVVTNSFHGTAMSILFHKKFAVFSHQTRGARIRDVLKAAHLENRLAQEARDADRMEERIDWDEVDRALEIPKRESVKFIRESILGT